MLLQTRIILFVVGTVATVAALLLGIAGLREDAADRHARQLELARLETSWQLAVANAASRVEQGLGRVAADPDIAQAMLDGARGPLARRLEALSGRENLSDLNLFSASGELLYSSDVALDPTPLVGRAPVGDLLEGRRFAGGIRQLDGERLVVVSGTAVHAGGRVAGAAVAGAGLPTALEALQRLIGGRVFAVTRNGEPIEGANDPLWPAVRGLIQPAARAVTPFAHDDRRYDLASLPVADLAGGRVATVLVASDVTQTVVERRLWTAGYVAAIALVLLTALTLLLAYLRASFATLDVAVRALLDLSQGRATGYVELPAGNDEIGRIAHAVEVFRGVMRDLERTAGQRERRLGRQQRFIRRQMEALASTLDEEARQALLDELRQMEMESHDPQSEQSRAVNDELGLIALGFSRLATRVSTQQVQLVQLVRDLREALEDKRRLITLQQELEIARTMQLTILPQVFPDLPQLDIAARMMPAKEVGGDFYDVFPIDGGRLAVTIADVSGKGIPAAFFMLITRTMLRAIAESGVGPAETMRRVNNLLAAENEQSMFVTVFYGELDLRTGVLTYSNGGHNPPLRVDRAGAVNVLERTPGIALAAMPDMPFGERAVQLEEGDSLLLFTDGVTEAFDTGGAMFGDDKLVATMAAQDVGSGALDRLEGMLAAVDGFAAGAPQSDDITALVIRWRGLAATLGMVEDDAPERARGTAEPVL